MPIALKKSQVIKTQNWRTGNEIIKATNAQYRMKKKERPNSKQLVIKTRLDLNSNTLIRCVGSSS
jgi:hypothetical protein